MFSDEPGGVLLWLAFWIAQVILPVLAGLVVLAAMLFCSFVVTTATIAAVHHAIRRISRRHRRRPRLQEDRREREAGLSVLSAWMGRAADD
ncbi:hypothetical protein [Microtetraspora glauca]|uniref:DUF4229 domain-containing protein n=1 Tax=Microtetraspora glauca TaxID=1996 RepID=A0ABV3GAS0_MICGL